MGMATLHLSSEGPYTAVELGQPSNPESGPVHPKDRSCLCPLPPPESKEKCRNLVVTIDGTSKKFGLMNTNVIELYSRLASNEEQLSYYNSGVGTYAQPSWRSWNYLTQVIDSKIDSAIAWNFERVVIGAYRWLSERYRPGDRIFLFGFSRGAYQARVLAGMIEKIGLIREGNEEQIPFAFELYAGRNNDETAKHFKNTFSKEGVRVHFVGVWDTVSSVGIVRQDVLPLVNSYKHICVFRHALALDERRVKFLPECIMRGEQPSKGSDVKEVWFAGSHSDVGGGNLRNDELNLESAPLLWMEHEAAIAGLHLRQSSVEWKIRDLEKTQPHESLTYIWRPLEYLPLRRAAQSRANSTTRFPHHAKGRTIYTGQKIHASVAFKAAGYEPKARFPKGETAFLWKDIVAQGPSGNFRQPSSTVSSFLELDLFDLTAAHRMIEYLRTHLTAVSVNDALHILNRLSFLAISKEGRDVIIESGNNQVVLEKLISSHADDRKPVFLATAKLLAKLAPNDTSPLPNFYRDIVSESNVIAQVVASLKAGDRGAADAIAELARLSGARTQILTLDIIPVLVDMLVRAHSEATNAAVAKYNSGAAADAIVALAKYGDAQAVSRAIPALVNMLESDSCEPAANALADLAQYTTTLDLILQEIRDTIRMLGKMLDSELKNRRSSAVRALGRFAQHSDTARKTIVGSYGSKLTAIAVAMLSGDDRTISADTLATLLIKDEDGSVLDWILNRSRAASLHKDIAIPLTSMLESKHDCTSAAHVISALARKSHDVCLAIFRTEAPSLLMNMLCDADDSAAAAVEALAAIMHSDDDVTALKPTITKSISPSRTSALVKLVDDNTAHNSAVIVLCWLLEHDLKAMRDMILPEAESIVNSLADVLKTPQRTVSERAMKGLRAIADINKARTKLIELKVVCTLIKMLADQPAASQNTTPAGLADTAAYLRNAPSACSDVPAALQNTVPGAAAKTVKELLGYPDIRSATIDSKVIKQLECILGTKSHVRVCEIIQSFAQHEDGRKMIKDSYVIPILLQLSHRGILVRVIESDRCLNELAKHGMIVTRKNRTGAVLWYLKSAVLRFSVRQK